MTVDTRGAYGFRLRYADPTESLDDLVVQEPDAPVVSVSWHLACPTHDMEEVDQDRVAYGARRRSGLFVERRPPSIRFHLPDAPPPGSLIHPLLTVGISILARWRGDGTLHAGAFETPAGAWGVLGARRSGKSAMLAALARRGLPIVADDLVTVQEGSVWAGPNCVDLRPDTARRFAGVRYLGIVGRRPRYRLSTAPGRNRLPLRGFFILDWHDEPAVRSGALSAEERLEWMYRQEYIPLVGFSDPRQLLPLVGLPAWWLRRPRDWGATEEAVDHLLKITAT